MPRAIHQLVHTLNYGDAISGEALLIRRLLQARGIASEIYCVHAHEKVKSAATPFAQLDLNAGSRDAALLLHYSLGSPLNDLYRAADRFSRALLYHNLTPEKWFRAYNARVTEDLSRGRIELPQLLKLSDLVLADSTFNRDELVPMGCATATVLPLAFDGERWSEPANAGVAGILRGHGGTNILHVGRLAPNKCIEDIIKAFYFYHHKINRKSRLWLIGIDIDTEIYSFELRRLVSELRLNEAVHFAGAPSDGELRAFYENSDLYLSMSEHEGFCLPLLEAMYFGVPVVAFDACAVAETLGEAGVLLARKAPAEVAELIEMVTADATLRQRLISAGKERVKRFSADGFAGALDSLLLDRLTALSSTQQAPTSIRAAGSK